MNESLVLGVLRELAIIKGVRTVEGVWTGSAVDLRETLKEAMRMVDNVSAERETEKAT